MADEEIGSLMCRGSFIKSAAVEAIRSNHNQYTRPGGHPDLVHTLADMYSDLMGRKIDPMSEIMTFTGAQEGIFSIFGALMNEVRKIQGRKAQFCFDLNHLSSFSVCVRVMKFLL